MGKMRFFVSKSLFTIILFIFTTQVNAQLEFEEVPELGKPGINNSFIKIIDNSFWATYDDGASWLQLPRPETEDNLSAVKLSDYKILLYSFERTFYYSYDEGQTWDTFDLFYPVLPYTYLTVKAYQNGFIFGDYRRENFDWPELGTNETYKYDIANGTTSIIYDATYSYGTVSSVFESSSDNIINIGHTTDLLTQTTDHGIASPSYINTTILEYNIENGTTSGFTLPPADFETDYYFGATVGYYDFGDGRKIAGTQTGLFYYNSETENWDIQFEDKFKSIFAMLRVDNEIYMLASYWPGVYPPNQIESIILYRSIDEGQSWSPVSNINWGPALAYEGFANTFIYLVNNNLYIQVVDKWKKSMTAVSSDEQPTNIPTTFSISSIYPNPFNPTTNIHFTLPQSGNVLIQVFDINGRLVDTLTNGVLIRGQHTITWNAHMFSSGLYFTRILYNDTVLTGKMLLIK